MAARKSKQTRRSTSYHHGDLRAALLAAAGQVLEEEGAEAVSFRAIARKVGVSQTAPYNHFESKEHLLATVAEEGFRAFTRAQLAAARTRSPRRRIDALGQAYVAFARTHPQLYRLMFGVGLPDWKRYPALVDAAEAACVPVQQALAAGGSRSTTAGRTDWSEPAWIATWALVHGLASLMIDGKVDSRGVGRRGDRITSWYASRALAGPRSQRA